MSNISDAKKLVLSKLQTLPVCKPDNMHTQWYIRCPYCGDSRDPSHGHLSVKINIEDDNDPMVYNCLKCPESGIVNSRFMEDLGLYIDNEEYKTLKSAYTKTSRKNKYTNDRIENYIAINPTMNKVVEDKLAYINGRLGTNLGPNDCSRLKLIPDFFQFMMANKIYQFYNTSPGLLKFLQYNYIGFLSQSNNRITCRCIRNDPKMQRYHKVIINPKNLNPASFYIIPNSIQTISDEPLKVYIAEGTFDIISILENVKNGDMNSRTLYGAACGFGLSSIIQYLIYNGLAYNLELENYCDNDKSDKEEIAVLIKRPEVIPWLNKVTFHRNIIKGEKDFGVTKERIRDGSYLIGENGILRKI